MSNLYLILSADKWQMKDELTGKMNSGTSIWAINDYRDDSDNSKGFKPTKLSGSNEAFEEIKKARLPALFEVDFDFKPGAQGKLTAVVKSFKKVKEVTLFNQTV